MAESFLINLFQKCWDMKNVYILGVMNSPVWDQILESFEARVGSPGQVQGDLLAEGW